MAAFCRPVTFATTLFEYSDLAWLCVVRGFPGLGGPQGAAKSPLRTPGDRESELTWTPSGTMGMLLEFLSTRVWKVCFHKEVWFPDSSASPRGLDHPETVTGIVSDLVFTA